MIKKSWKVRGKDKESLLSTVLSSGRSWGALGRYPGWSKRALLGRGVILKTFISSHTNNSLSSPTSSDTELEPVTNRASFCVSRGQSGGPASPPPSVRVPGRIIQAIPSTSRKRCKRDIAGRRKGKGQWITQWILPGGWRVARRGGFGSPLVAGLGAFSCKPYFLEEEFLRG